MRLLPHSPRLSRPAEHKLSSKSGRDSATAALLGAQHPLARVLERLETATEALFVVAAMHALGLFLWLQAFHAGAALTVSSLALETLIGFRVALLSQTRNELCLGVIVEGRERLPLAAIARERCRLSSPAHQARLARSITELADSAEQGVPQPLSARPALDRRTVQPVIPQLDEIADRLRAADPPIRGVALAQLLLCSPASVLYGSEPDALKRELGRLRYLLDPGGAPGRSEPAAVPHLADQRTAGR